MQPTTINQPNISHRFAPKSLDYYKDLTNGASGQVALNQQQACVVLKAYDYGIDNLSADERQQLEQVVGKLKDIVWP